MRLAVRHRTHYTYDPEALRLAFRLRLFPSNWDGQTVSEWSVKVNGVKIEPLLIDGFGDAVAVWHAHKPCGSAEIIAEGVVETQDKAGVVKGLRRRPPASVFLRETELTEADEAIEELAASIGEDNMLARMHALMAAVGEVVQYRPAATGEMTTASQALAMGAGVCQDHAHVFIAAARVMGVPARYVTGYLAMDGDGAAVTETHAWAEAHVDEIGWIGFDVTNGMCPTDQYIRLACGMDAHAAAPIRGNVVGETDIELEADVAIESSSSQSQSQSQS